MWQALAQWPAADRIFLLAGIAGGLSFTIWLVLQFVGGLGEGGGGDVDTGAADGGGDVSGSADISFTLLSFQGISSFFTMFGFVGLSARREMHLPVIVAVAIGVVSGLLMSWLIARLFRFFHNLQSSGTLDPNRAAGQEGSVYLRIPAGGTGKVQLSLQGRLQVMEAVSDHAELIDSGQRVRVVRVVDGHTLVVAPLVMDTTSEGEDS
ncbi:MAG: NfeD family protein [Polyangiales bacterium]